MESFSSVDSSDIKMVLGPRERVYVEVFSSSRIKVEEVLSPGDGLEIDTRFTELFMGGKDSVNYSSVLPLSRWTILPNVKEEEVLATLPIGYAFDDSSTLCRFLATSLLVENYQDGKGNNFWKNYFANIFYGRTNDGSKILPINVGRSRETGKVGIYVWDNLIDTLKGPRRLIYSCR